MGGMWRECCVMRGMWRVFCDGMYVECGVVVGV